MAARIRLLQMAIAAVNIAIVALAFTSIWPFPHGDFKVDLPSPNEVTWTYSDGMVHVTAPYSIDNGGYYDVHDLTIDYIVFNSSRYLLANQTLQIGDIPAGQITSSEIDFQFDLLRLFNDGALGMVLTDDLLTFVVDVSCGYTMDLVKFEATYQVSVPWDALIRSYGPDWSRSHLPDSIPPTNLPPYSVAYWLNTSDILAGLPPAQVTLTLIGNTTGALMSGSTTIQLGGDNYGIVMFDSSALLQYTDVPYALRYNLQVAGFGWTGTVPIQGWFP
ncbi:MAG: hypothetical protein NTY62_08145 [Euryarchaeota archaeon]|nr:hypothetical protein [Euryarchaeota archaeon]